MNEMTRPVPNPESKILASAIIGGAGLGGPPSIDAPPGKASIVLFVPEEYILGNNPLEIQRDLGLPWECDGVVGGVFLEDLT